MPSAPVCHISSDQVIQQPKQQQLPSIGKATDLKSALQVINQMTIIINMLTGQQQINAGGIPRPNDGRPAPQQQTQIKPTKKQPGQERWIEANRSTQIVRVFNPKDKEQWVDIESINSLDMIDGVTGETWHWQRQR